MRHLARLATAVLLIGAAAAAGAAPSAAATLPAPPHSAVGGFSVNGAGFSLVYADGSVRPGPYGDAFSLHLPLRITAAAPVRNTSIGGDYEG